jgi:hypothetical protein
MSLVALPSRDVRLIRGIPRILGMSLEIQPLGAQHIILNGNERYSWWVVLRSDGL